MGHNRLPVKRKNSLSIEHVTASKPNKAREPLVEYMWDEIDYEKIDKIRGMDICITTSAKTNDDAKALLKAFSFPFKN